MAAVILANYPLIQIDSKATSLEYGLYDSLSRVGWAIALCYIIFACVHGYGGPINWFLSHPLWQPLSRLSYSIYVVHFPVIVATMVTIKTSPYFSEFNAVSKLNVLFWKISSHFLMKIINLFAVARLHRELCFNNLCCHNRNTCI